MTRLCGEEITST